MFKSIAFSPSPGRHGMSGSVTRLGAAASGLSKLPFNGLGPGTVTGTES